MVLSKANTLLLYWVLIHLFSFFFKFFTDITEFRIDQPFRSFKYENGRLIAEKDGAYFIYAQLFFGNYSDAVTFHNRVALVVNGAIFSYLQTSLGGGGADYGSVFTEGIAPLRTGEYIKLSSIWDSNVWMKPAHTFFGAYKISDIPRRKRQCNKYWRWNVYGEARMS